MLIHGRCAAFRFHDGAVSSLPHFSMMEQADAREAHDHSEAVAGVDHQIVADGTAGLRHIFDAALRTALDVVCKREERIRPERDIFRVRSKISLLLFSRKQLRLLFEIILPHAVLQKIFAFLSQIEVDGVVALRPSDVLPELKVQNASALAKPPKISLRSGKPRAVDSRLLPCADADGLTFRCVADRIRLRVFQRDQGNNHVADCFLRQVLVLRDNIRKQVFPDDQIVPALLKRHAEDLLVLDRIRHIGRIDLHDVVGTLPFRLQDLQRFRFEIRCDDSV